MFRLLIVKCPKSDGEAIPTLPTVSDLLENTATGS